ncbi:MAG: hypothetical protein LBT08_06260 [Synergistaceae bacterium]|jgi:putative peptidoglycan lipid II flippase|nr:hypothetical protein [Synergistaceae bacterium]
MPGISFITRLIRRLLSVRSTRGVSFTLSFLAVVSKPLGYIRMLITAWAFGTSPGMDSFHMANSIISLFAMSIGSAFQSALLPEIVRVRHETGGDACSRSITALASCVVLPLVALFCAAIAIAPGVIVKFFASGFDPERIRVGAIMLWWLAPLAIVTMCKPIADIWAVFNERYTLSSLCSLSFNLVAIPSLLIAMPLAGVYSVAISTSAAQIVIFITMCAALGGVPLIWKRSELPIASLVRITKNTLYVLVIVAGGAMMMMVDRYFASRLPSGSVTAVSYGAILIGMITIVADTPMTFLLSKLSSAAADGGEESKRLLDGTLAIVMAYFMPASILAAAAARPIVSLLYGWGNFDALSIDMTVEAFSAYCIGVAFALSANVLARYAQAFQKLGVIVVLSYVLIGTNALLDWLMITRWGILGLAFATSMTQIMSFLLYYLFACGGGFVSFLTRTRFLHQISLTLACAAATASCVSLGTAAHLGVALLAALFYMVVAERFNLMPCVPEHWRPRKLASFLVESAKSYFMPI